MRPDTISQHASWLARLSDQPLITPVLAIYTPTHLEADGVHAGRQHAHVVRGGAVQPLPCVCATEVIAAAHDYGHLHALP